MNERLHLYRLVLADPRAPHRFARQLRLPDHPFDPDYVVHGLLSELFGPKVVKPFVRDPRHRGTAVLGYTFRDSDALRKQAQTIAPPEVYRTVDWNACVSKPMPIEWSPGLHLGFRVRICPLVRGPSAHGREEIEVRKARPEVDAYLARVWREDESVSREEVYRQWLARELCRNGAAEMESARMTGFRLSRLLRRGRKRVAQGVTRPDAVFKGTLRLLDGTAFSELLVRGLGRHRAFGFGMLLLRPVTS